VRAGGSFYPAGIDPVSHQVSAHFLLHYHFHRLYVRAYPHWKCALVFRISALVLAISIRHRHCQLLKTNTPAFVDKKRTNPRGAPTQDRANGCCPGTCAGRRRRNQAQVSPNIQIWWCGRIGLERVASELEAAAREHGRRRHLAHSPLLIYRRRGLSLGANGFLGCSGELTCGTVLPHRGALREISRGEKLWFWSHCVLRMRISDCLRLARCPAWFRSNESFKSWKQRRANTGGDAIWRRAPY